jgi:integrase
VAKIANLKGSAKRFNARKGGGGSKWHSKVDAVRLDAITKEAVHKWRLDFVKRAGVEPTAQIRAKVSCNSVISQARGLFSKRLVELGRPRMALPDPLPFEGAEKFTKLRSYMRYQSKINAIAILNEGREELVEQKPEQFKILVLAVCCGLRRNEIDKLIWSQVDFDAAVIRIQTTRFFKAKSDDSNATVDLEPEIVALLRGWKTRAKSQFVVESDLKPRLQATYDHYRTAPHLNALVCWLRAQGVDDVKPLHTLRKEYGCIVTEKMGIYAASRALRHADVQVTAMHYVDQKQRIVTGLGAVLAPENVTKGNFFGKNTGSSERVPATKRRPKAPRAG